VEVYENAGLHANAIPHYRTKFLRCYRKASGELLPEAFIRVKTFKSDAVVRESLRRKGNREVLSMVMLDYDSIPSPITKNCQRVEGHEYGPSR